MTNKNAGRIYNKQFAEFNVLQMSHPGNVIPGPVDSFDHANIGDVGKKIQGNFRV